mgnify:CR=1 FL=1
MHRTVGHQADVLKAIRTKICLADPRETLSLKETALAQEFGISRTPIRHILQLLGNTQLLETQSGHGTQTTVLKVEDLSKHFETYGSICDIAISVAKEERVPRTTTLELMSVHNTLLIDDDRSPTAFIDIYGRIIDAMAHMISDPIICFAHQAAFWRLIRWRVQEVAAGVEGSWGLAASNLQTAIDAATKGTERDLLEISGRMGRSHIERMIAYYDVG